MESYHLRLQEIVQECFLILSKSILAREKQLESKDILHQLEIQVEKERMSIIKESIKLTLLDKQQSSPKPSWSFQNPVENAFLKVSPKKLNIQPVSKNLYHENTRQQVSVAGVLYSNSRKAAIVLELYQNSVTKRCLSPNEEFKDWFFVSIDTGQPIPKRIIESTGKHGNSFKISSKELRQKLSKLKLGKKQSEQSRQKNILEHQSRISPRRHGQPIRVNGVNYSSFSAAGMALQLCSKTVSKRCRNPRPEFKDWVILSGNIQMLKQA